MEKVKLRDLMARIVRDQRMLHSHLCLYTALLSLREKGKCSNTFRVSRKELMLLSKIKSTATYHKCMAQLVCCEYIIYRPSYDYFRGSQVTLLIDEGELNESMDYDFLQGARYYYKKQIF